MNGWIKLSRDLLETDLYQDANAMRIYIHCLLKATSKKYKIDNIELQPGQFTTGRKMLAKEVNLSEQQIRTGLKKLEATNKITIKSTSQYSLITVIEWASTTKPKTKVTSKITSTITTKQEYINNMSVSQFEEFWKLYPRKLSKTKTKEKYLRLKLDLHKTIIDSLKRYIKTEWQNTEPKFIPHATTWINQKRWEDMEEVSKPKPKKYL